MIDYSLYLVTDDPSRYAGNWLDNVVAAVEGGVTCVQYRDTESAPDVRLARVRALQDALKRFRTPLVVNNEAALAAAVRAEGIHVGQRDLPPAAVRAIVGPACEIGLSITDIAQICPPCDAVSHRVYKSTQSPFDAVSHRVYTNAQFPVDALGVGPVFDARKTKADASDAMGLGGLAAIVAHVKDVRRETGNARLPAVAIGGITLANAASVLAAGADGLAVVSAFSKSADPFAAARAFRNLFK